MEQSERKTIHRNKPYKKNKTMETKKNPTCSNTLLPAGIVNLDYSEKQRLFHFDYEPQKKNNKDWIKLKAMSVDDAIKFCDFMDKKYVNGRVTGNLPELSVVKLELELFFELKNTRRRLAGR
jgi:hypothetical protein